MKREKKYIHNGKVEICTESFGNSENTPIILIMGLKHTMLWWNEKFCMKLVEHGFFVIRFDNRGVGESIINPQLNALFSVMDMVEDVIAIMKSYEIQHVHIAGTSFGGVIGQILAVMHPDIIESLTLIGSAVLDNQNNLPGPTWKIRKLYDSASDLDWGCPNDVKEYLLKESEMLCGIAHAFDKCQAELIIKDDIQRSRKVFNSSVDTPFKSIEHLYGKYHEIMVPTIVIHGTEDRVYPFKHAFTLATTIESAELVPLEGSGHEIHQDDWEKIIESICKVSSNKNIKKRA